MAQDLFFLPLDRETKLVFDRDVVKEILSRGAIQPIAYDRLRYPDRSGGETYAFEGDPSKPIDYLSFTRFGGRTMMERLFELADRFDAVLAWSDVGAEDPAACVTREPLFEQVAELYKPLRIVFARDAKHLYNLVKRPRVADDGW